MDTTHDVIASKGLPIEDPSELGIAEESTTESCKRKFDDRTCACVYRVVILY